MSSSSATRASRFPPQSVERFASILDTRANLASAWSAVWQFCIAMRRALSLSFCGYKDARGSDQESRFHRNIRGFLGPRMGALRSRSASVLHKTHRQLTHFAEIQFSGAQIRKRVDVEKL